MQSNNLQFVITSAQDRRHREPIARAVRKSIEVGVVVPSILRANLAEAGFEVKQDTASISEYGFASMSTLKRVLVTEKGALVAMGAAGDHDEALLHAMLGWFREHPLEDQDVPQGLGTAPGAPMPPPVS